MASISFLFSKISNIIALLGATSQIYLTFVTPIILYIKAFPLSEAKKNFYILMLIVLVSIGLLHLANYIYDIIL
jgi:hypothetical protein